MIDKITAPYIGNVKKEFQFPKNKKSLIWDAFKGQGTPRVQERLAELGLVVMVENMTHLLQPLDVTTNSTIKKKKKKEFSKIASIITNKMLTDSSRDA